MSQVTLYRRIAEANAVMEAILKASPDDLPGLKAMAERFLADSTERRAEATTKARAASIESKKRKFAETYAPVRARILELIGQGVTKQSKIAETLLAEGFKPPQSDQWRYRLLVAIAPELKKA